MLPMVNGREVQKLTYSQAVTAETCLFGSHKKKNAAILLLNMKDSYGKHVKFKVVCRYLEVLHWQNTQSKKHCKRWVFFQWSGSLLSGKLAVITVIVGGE